MKMLLVIVGVVILLGSAVRLFQGDDPESNSNRVPWEDYAPSLRAEINAAHAAGDCADLQRHFDVAESNNAATENRTGHNNAAMMSYIDALMSEAGCYD